MWNVYWYVLWNKTFINKLICVEIYDLAKIIYQRALWKGFYKTSLSLLDLRFKNLIFQEQTFRPSREEGRKACNELRKPPGV